MCKILTKKREKYKYGILNLYTVNLLYYIDDGSSYP